MEAGLRNLASALDAAVHAAGSLIVDAPPEIGNEAADARTAEAFAPDSVREIVARLQHAAEIGDIAELQSVAGELGARSAEAASIGRQILTLVEDFNMEGILKLAGELWESP
jgi:hypothetical protein